VTGSLLLLEDRPTFGPIKTTRRHGVDVSNYTSPLSPAALAEWRDVHDIGLVIVQAINPPSNFPTGKTRQQIEMCAQAGIATDAYVFLWTAAGPADIGAKLATLNGLEHHVRKLWLDVEDTAGASIDQRLTSIRQALAVCDEWSKTHGKPRPGIYTGRWWWQGYLGNTTEFGDRDLWTSQYDGIDDATVFSPYGGWKACRIKQHAGTSTLAGVGNVDLNVLSDAEAAQL
jgi:GH25 family lysozyme M1 (1,4-beta-N-acetylmuramidase)